MPNTQSGINDDELNQMIASLQRNQDGASNIPNAPAGQKVIQPPVQPQNAKPLTETNPISDVFNHPPMPTNIDPAHPINLSEVGRNMGQNNQAVTTTPASTPADVDTAVATNPTSNDVATMPVANGANTATGEAAGDLAEIKRQAITELRPLVDKLDLSPEDKFDTLLLLIRTTDDSSLIPSAHTAALAISDDTRRAQALLDVIKEIDFFGRK